VLAIARGLLPALAVLTTIVVVCTQPTIGFRACVFKGADGQNSRYVLFVPHDYVPDKPLPVILFLHGSGEAGTDGWRPTHVGLGPAIWAREASFPFLVVFPQAQDRIPATFGSWLPGQPDANRALAILDEVQRQYTTDPKRVYLTGISVGGHGTWQIAAAYPEHWAAIVPVCGVAPVTKANAVKNIPCWCFHGTDDGNVDVEHSRNMIGALRRAGGGPKYTEYVGVGHNSWDKAYATDELYEWLLQQRLQ
jgi:predicted peptidase